MNKIISLPSWRLHSREGKGKKKKVYFRLGRKRRIREIECERVGVILHRAIGKMSMTK